MAFDEEYLEDLLKSIEPIVNPNGEVSANTDPDEIPDMPEEELDSNEAEPEEMVIPEETEEDIPVPSEVTVPEETVAEAMPEEVEASAEDTTPVANLMDEINPEDANKTLSADEIAAMFAAVDSAEEVAEEPVAEEVVESVAEAAVEEIPIDDADALISEMMSGELSGETNDAIDIAGDVNDAIDLAEIPVDMDDIDAFLNAAKEESASSDEEMALEAMLEEVGEKASEEIPVDMDLDMSVDEIDAMLNAAKESANAPADTADGGDDLMSLLSNVGDEDLSDIQSILDSDESGDAVAAAALDATTNVEDVASTVLETEKEAKARKKKEKKEARKNKKNKKAEDASAASDSGEPKKNIFVRIIEALTESEDDDDFGIGDAVIVQTDETITPEEGMSGISDENKEILAELDEEKGKKKKKKKKGKKGKEEENPDGEEGEEGEEGDSKKKKKKKPKKEKKPKAEAVEEYQKPEKRLPRKKVRATFALSFTILVAILLAVFGLDRINTLRDARWAFDNQDYETAYEDLYGVNVKGNDAAIFNKSQTILQVERKYKSYQNYLQLGMNYEAVDSLLEAVKLYPSVREKAVTYGVEGQTDYTYSLIISALQGMGVSESDAMEINAYDSKVRYTKRVKSIADGTPYTYDDEIAAEYVEDTVAAPANTVDDILPEENDFLPDDPNSIFEVEMDFDAMEAQPTEAAPAEEAPAEAAPAEDGREIMSFAVSASEVSQ